MIGSGPDVVLPLRVSCHLWGLMRARFGYVHLDALLAAAEAKRSGLPPAYKADELVAIEIPVERSGSGYHLATAAVIDYAHVELCHKQRRFPVEAAMMHGDERVSRSKINLAAGKQKHHRIPYEAGIPRDGIVEWYCLGDPEMIRALLLWVPHLGGYRGSGKGRITPGSWRVEKIWEWEGFPTRSPEGRPLRHLPESELQGVEGVSFRLGRLTYPYWLLGPTEQVVSEPERYVAP